MMNRFNRTPSRGPDIHFADGHVMYQERMSSQPSDFELERGVRRRKIEDIALLRGITDEIERKEIAAIIAQENES